MHACDGLFADTTATPASCRVPRRRRSCCHHALRRRHEVSAGPGLGVPHDGGGGEDHRQGGGGAGGGGAAAAGRTKPQGSRTLVRG